MNRSAVTTLLRLMALALALASVVSCKKEDSVATGPLFHQENTADNLKALVEAIVKAQEGGDLAQAAALTRGLIVDRDTLRKFFKDDAPSAFMATQAERLARFPTAEAELATLITRRNPARTQINVHGAIMEEIITASTPAAKEFSVLPRDFALNLRPAVTFYELEFVEPGKTAGLKYHLFLWDGERWRMLGPNWR